MFGSVDDFVSVGVLHVQVHTDALVELFVNVGIEVVDVIASEYVVVVDELGSDVAVSVGVDGFECVVVCSVSILV